jgi:hypothetical protein
VAQIGRQITIWVLEDQISIENICVLATANVMHDVHASVLNTDRLHIVMHCKTSDTLVLSCASAVFASGNVNSAYPVDNSTTLARL